MQHSQTERQKIQARVDHDLYLESVYKSPWLKNLEVQLVNGIITIEEYKKQALEFILAKKAS